MPQVFLQQLCVTILCVTLSACGGGGGGATTSNTSPDASVAAPASASGGTGQPISVSAADPAQARFSAPQGIKVSTDGNIYIADTGNYTIRKITQNGVVTTIAGTAGARGASDGTGPAARFTEPRAVTVDGSGNLYVTDGSVIRKIAPGGVVTTIAGTQDLFGSVDGAGSAATFRRPSGIAVDTLGNLYVADEAAANVRKITADGVVTTFAGGALKGPVDGVGTDVRLYGPRGITIDAVGNLYITDVATVAAPNLDVGATFIRKLTPSAVVTTIAGTLAQTISADYIADLGPLADFYYSNALDVDGAGNLYVADGWNRIRKVTPTGAVSTLPPALTNALAGLSLDAAGNMYGTDSGQHIIVKITPAGTIATYAGKAGEQGSADTP